MNTKVVKQQGDLLYSIALLALFVYLADFGGLDTKGNIGAAFAVGAGPLLALGPYRGWLSGLPLAVYCLAAVVMTGRFGVWGF